MRVLVIGAGVLGTAYAAKLAQAGQDVTVVERSPQRLAQIREHGLVIEKIGEDRQDCVRVPALDRIDAGAEFDVAIAIVRKPHLDAVLAELAPTPIPTLLFMVSNAQGPRVLVDAVGERALAGFPGAGGERAGHVVRYRIPPRFMQQTMLGEPDGSRSDRVRQLASMFDAAGFSAAVCPDLDAWLKSHESFVAATANATYAAGGDAHRLAHDPELLRLCVRSIQELYATLDALRVPVLPGWFRLWQRLPRRAIEFSFGRFLDSAAWELGTSQINSMRDEVELISQELLHLADTAGTPAPAFRELVNRSKTEQL
nr:FAD-dependent oxidoreductase [Actinoplanes sp. L3-i22]